MSLRTALLLVAGAVLACWLPSLDASFQFDDLNVIVAEARVQSLGAWAHSMPAIRPLLRLSYALNHAFGDGPAGFRLVNVLVHAGSACLVLLLLESLALRCGFEPARARMAALIAALLFALHPVQTEAVTYVSGRSSSLSGLLALGSLFAWSRSFAGANQPARRALAFALGLAALAVKETVVVLPLAMLLWALVPGVDAAEAAGAGDAGIRRRQLRSALAFAALLVAAGLALLALTPYADIARASLARRDPVQNLPAVAQALAWLLGQVAMPWRLAIDPDLRPATQAGLSAALVLGTAAAAVLGAALCARRWPAPAFALLWTAAWLLPLELLFPREDIANDRQLYLAMVGPAWLAGWWLATLPCALRTVAARRSARTAAPPAAALLIAALLVALGALTVARNRVYATEVVFWEAAATAAPGKPRVLDNLGYVYAKACRDDVARQAFSRAAQVDPRDIRSRASLKVMDSGERLRGTACPAGQPAPVYSRPTFPATH